MKAFYTLILVLLSFAAYGQTVSSWIQDDTTGCKVFNSYPKPNESIQITGKCVNGYLEGQGIVVWYLDGKLNGKREGFHLNGKLNGQGTINLPNGNKYVGEFKDGKHNGQGTFTDANGNNYVGEWKDDKPSQGTFTFSNGNKYVGEFKDGKYSGQGTYTWANGIKYVGDWKDGNPDGRGITYSANGSIDNSGIYKDNVLVTSQYIDPNSFTRIALGDAIKDTSDNLKSVKQTSFDVAKLKCEELGFKPATEAFGTCVLQLTK